jgi:hypothetical protein
MPQMEQQNQKLLQSSELATQDALIVHRSSSSSARKRHSRTHVTLSALTSFWDNLSRVQLTPKALKEFDRRTDRHSASSPPRISAIEEHSTAQVKRFARLGGPALDNIRGVKSVSTKFVYYLTHSSIVAVEQLIDQSPERKPALGTVPRLHNRPTI